jgi:hydroxymethylbilane synthase
MSKKIIIGSRGSELALWQANFVLGELERIGVKAGIKVIKTQGDIVQHLSWDKLEGKGFFTKEIEDALLKEEIDLAVHSHKDLPTEPVTGLVIAAVSQREDPSELLIIRNEAVEERMKFSVKKGAKVGTSSARRKSQLLAFRSDLKTEDLRGNVPTRINKLREGKYDAIMIAAAGVERLEIDLSEFHTEKLSPKEFVPAPAQGVLALQTREEDEALIKALQQLNAADVQEVISIERKVLNLFDGGCQLPLGSYCEKEENDEGEPAYNVWISKAESWNKFPRQFFFTSKKSEGFAEKIVEKMNAVKPCPIFITRDLRKFDYFRDALTANGFTVNGQSLIEIKAVPVRSVPKTEWVFFSSKHAVKFFFDLKPDLEGVKFGAVAKNTADELRKFGKRAEFIGSSNDTKLTGKKFAALAGGRKVLFPQAKESLKSIQLQMPVKNNVIDMVVYETIKKSLEPGVRSSEFGVIVFTSPSNVETFFEKNKVEGHQKVVAMGDATANALKKFGVRANRMPITFDDLGLVQAVYGV